jgi:hypothetical protein
MNLWKSPILNLRLRRELQLLTSLKENYPIGTGSVATDVISKRRAIQTHSAIRDRIRQLDKRHIIYGIQHGTAAIVRREKLTICESCNRQPKSRNDKEQKSPKNEERF